MTVCNMSIEAGARAGMIAPDDTTLPMARRPALCAAGRGLGRGPRALAPAAERRRRRLRPRVSARRQRDRADGHLGHQSRGRAADHRPRARPGRRDRPPSAARRCARALAYMGLAPGRRLTDMPVDRVFIGSCTNGRIEDLRSAAAVVRGPPGGSGRARPGSCRARAWSSARPRPEGLDRVFRDAGFQWRYAGCSMCLGTNGDQVAPGQRCASTSNRNFVGRQGPGSRTHLMSPAMAAAAAVTGRLTDVRGPPRDRTPEHGAVHAASTRLPCRSRGPTSTPTRSCRRATCRSRAPTTSATTCSAMCVARRRAAARADFALNRPAVCRRPHRRRRPQLRLRLVARARGVGALRRRLPRRDRAELRRHLPLQRAEERAAADRAARTTVVESLLDATPAATGQRG